MVMELLSIELQNEIRERVASGEFRNADELVRDALNLLDEQMALERELRKGLDSGTPIEATPEFWLAERARLREECHRSSNG